MILLFVIGGVSGFMTASVPVDWQLTDTYFVVAHLHYVLIGINVFPVVGAIYFWFPKMTGRMLDERLGRWNFWTMFIGFNLALPADAHHRACWACRAASTPTADGMGWDRLNLITTHRQLRVRDRRAAAVRECREEPASAAMPAAANPWDAPTLEWAVSSPPPPYNFAVIPTVATRHPLWEDRLGERGQRLVARSRHAARPRARRPSAPRRWMPSRT